MDTEGTAFAAVAETTSFLHEKGRYVSSEGSMMIG
jgi:hypothetical protein